METCNSKIEKITIIKILNNTIPNIHLTSDVSANSKNCFKLRKRRKMNPSKKNTYFLYMMLNKSEKTK